MHCTLVADLAALVSQHGPAILCGRDTIPSHAIAQYWSASSNRFELWHQTLARYRRAQQSGETIRLKAWWTEHVTVLEEVLVTEMLTRVVAALAAGLDKKYGIEELSPVTHAVHLNHLEARNRVQQIMLFGRGNSVQDAVRLNRLRQGVERWTDTLIGCLASQHPELARYGMNQDRTRQHAEEYRSSGIGIAQRTTHWLMNSAMNDMLRRRTSKTTALPQANRNVAASVVMMLRPDLFDSVGALKSLWLHRLQSSTHQADRVLEELKQPDIEKAVTADGMDSTSGNFLDRWYC
ncbi:hypothetical protein Pla22_40380 [Rubripirellula amarantea]|uniref:Uncharacterized protein n=1 Tax=Rubripirellula amarantea TaxID=2527999 RepID=A0A5C5WME1_9BACT|nr:hypothetical protein [Rubripirellula amarantea]TWT51261.1 hypothetical protein Pla22_40380 [Rubripirellula amarantea]